MNVCAKDNSHHSANQELDIYCRICGSALISEVMVCKCGYLPNIVTDLYCPKCGRVVVGVKAKRG